MNKKSIKKQTYRVFDLSTLEGLRKAERYKNTLENRTFETAERAAVRTVTIGLERCAVYMERVSGSEDGD